MPDKNAAAPVATPEEVAKLAEEQTTEYGTYFAVAPIAFNGAPAYNAGDPVPVSNVKKYGYDTDGLVEKAGSAAGNKVAAALAEQATASPNAVVAPQVSLNIPVK
jgi:hypothetical protein